MANILRVFLVGLSYNLIIDIKFINGRLCDCELVKEILTYEIFDLKLANQDLTAKLEKLESSSSSSSTTTTRNRLHGPSTSASLDRIEMLETRVSALLSKNSATSSSQPTSSTTSQSQMIVDAFRAEKTQRHTMEMEMISNIQQLNDSVQTVNEQVAKIVDEKLGNLASRMSELETNVSKNLESLERDLQEKDADEIDNLRTRIVGFESKALDIQITNISDHVQHVLQRIDGYNETIVKIEADLDAVVNIAILHQEASCYPKCANGGVCFRDNTCKCKPPTAGLGPHCEHDSKYSSYCRTEEFLCREIHECIHRSWVCDNDEDCIDGTDERHC